MIRLSRAQARSFTVLLVLFAACGDDADAVGDAAKDAVGDDASTPDARVSMHEAGANDQDAAWTCATNLAYPNRVKRATPSPDGKGFCCERGAPSCHGGFFGGFVEDACECGKASSENAWVDLAPPDWMPATDEHGCAIYQAHSPATACCNCWLPDAGNPYCDALDTTYKFSLEVGAGEPRVVYAVSGSGTVERERFLGALELDAGVGSCTGSLAACAALATDVADFQVALRGASEEWWDGPVLSDDPSYSGPLLIVERSRDGKKLRFGKACTPQFCSVPLSQFHSLYEGLRTDVTYVADGGCAAE